MAASVAYMGFDDNTANAVSYTFNDQQFGAPAADRLIAVAFLSRASGNRQINSVTIGGVQAVEVAKAENTSGGNLSLAAIFVAQVPTGSSGTVFIGFLSSMAYMAVYLYRITGSTGIVTDSATSTSNNPSVTLDVEAGGVALACGYTQANATATWTGLTEDFENVTIDSGDPRGTSAASQLLATAQIDMGIGCTWSSNSVPAFVAASFQPSPLSIAPKMQHYRRLRI